MFHTTPGPTVAVDLSTRDRVAKPVDVTSDHVLGEVVHIDATDLVDAQNQRTWLRAERSDAGLDPNDVSVILRVDAHIAADGRTARKELASADPVQSTALTYVGTPAGLAGLIADVKAAEVADGVTIHPILDAPDVRAAVVTRIVDGVLPWLAERGVAADTAATDSLLVQAGVDPARRTLAS